MIYCKRDERENFWSGKKSPFSYSRRNSIIRSMGFKNYRDYLNSDIWDAIREAALKKYDNGCVCCGNTATQVHHTRYIPSVMAGHPKALEYLVAICEKCHSQAEFLCSGKKDSVLGALNYIRKHSLTHGQCGECGKVVLFGDMVTKTGRVSKYCLDCRVNHMSKKKRLALSKKQLIGRHKDAKKILKQLKGIKK